MTVRHNIDIDTLEAFRAFLDDNPDKGRIHLEAKAVYHGQAGRSIIHVGPFAIDDAAIDRPERRYDFNFGARREIEEMIGVEGAGDRLEPVEMVLASTAACLINSITLNAARIGINPAGLEITVRTTLDPRVLLALKSPEDHGASIGRIEYDVKVNGAVSDADMETINKLCRYSPVHAMMAETIEIIGNVSRA